MTTTAVTHPFAQALAEEAFLEQVPALYTLREKALALEADKRDHRIVVGQQAAPTATAGIMGFSHEGKLIANPAGNAQPAIYSLTDNAWSQLCSRLGEGLLGKSSATLHKPTFQTGMQHTNPGIRSATANLLNEIMGSSKRNVLLLRAYQDSARAVLSSSYADVGNLEMVGHVIKALEMQTRRSGLPVENIKVVRRGITPDDLYLTVVTVGIDPHDAAQPDAAGQWEGGDTVPGAKPYGLGVNISNNETGNGRLKVTPVIQRGSCSNSIWLKTADALNLVHRGSRHNMAYQVAHAIGSALQIGAEYLNRLMQSRSVEIENVYGAIEALAKDYGWSTETAGVVLKGTEGQNSLYGLVNGVSYAAQHIDALPLESVALFEGLAGDLLSNPGSVLKAREHAWVSTFAPVKQR